MKFPRVTCAPFTVSGTGNAVAFFHFFSPSKTGQLTPQTKHNGKIRRILIRQDAGGGATAADAYIVHRSRTPLTSPSAIPEEYVPVEILAIPLTASADESSFDSPIDMEPAFQDSCAIVFDVTGVGAWTLVGYVEMEG